MFGYDIYDFVECTEKEYYVLENKWFAGYILFEINTVCLIFLYTPPDFSGNQGNHLLTNFHWDKAKKKVL